MFQGTVKGGGTVEFTVAPDGASLSMFEATFPPCGMVLPARQFVNLTNYSPGAPPPAVTAGAFAFGKPSNGARITGHVLAGGTAEGTIEQAAIEGSAEPACKVDRVLTWNATLVPASAGPEARVDPCSLLVPADLAKALGADAHPGRSWATLGGGLNDRHIVRCTWSGGGGVSWFEIAACDCQSTLAQFDAWVRFEHRGKLTAVAGIGERAYLLPDDEGIVFRQRGVDVEIQSSEVKGVSEMGMHNANAEAFYTNLARKVISRLP